MKARRFAFVLFVLALLTLCALPANAQVLPQLIDVSPLNPTVAIGGVQQFTALHVSPLQFGAVSSITAGEAHTCALIPNGTVQCWGLNDEGQLGNGTFTDSPLPVTVAGVTTATSVSAGRDHTCAVLSDGTVKCWGWGTHGQLGNGQTDDSYWPVAVSGLSGVTAVAAGYLDTCALLVDGTVQCWGDYSGSTTPVPATGPDGTPLTGAIAIAASEGGSAADGSGVEHMCALISNGRVICWGDDSYGQLGQYGGGPVQVQIIGGVTGITTGGAHTCASLSDGSVSCWGSNSNGQLTYNGSGSYNATPTPAGQIDDAISVAAGTNHSCALLVDGSLQCWGDDSAGELGNGAENAGFTDPQSVMFPIPAKTVVAGGNHTCVLLVDGSVWCFGSNFFGDLGNGSTTDSSSPVQVVFNNLGAQGADQIALGEYASHTCAVLVNGTGKCWGANGRGQLGDGTTNQSSTPVAVTAQSGIKQMVTGGVRTCSVLGDGSLWCWGGNNTAGDLGNGSTADSLAAVESLSLGVKSVSAGGGFSCALLYNGSVSCFGANDQGQLGNGTFTNSSVPVQVIAGDSGNLSAVKAITTGEEHACALLDNGLVVCWGATSAGVVPYPISVAGLSDVTAISAGGDYTCARKSDGTVWCWGIGTALGDGSTDGSENPVQALLPGPVAAVTAGRQTACAVDADGTAQCWGYNGAGALGNGTTTDSTTPVAVQGLSGAVAITIGDHVCSLLYNGGAECWGYNYYGQLGNGTNTDSTIPVPVSPMVTLLRWTSSQPDIATIDPVSGLAIGSSVGSTIITATYGTLSVSTTLNVISPTPLITWPTPVAIPYGTALSGVQLNATANVPGLFYYSPEAGTVLAAGPQVLSVTFIPDDQVHFTTTSTTVTLNVLQATPTIAVTGGSFTYDGNPHGATATATGITNLPVSGTFVFSYAPPGGPIAPSAAGNYMVIANFLSQDPNYSNSSGTGSITIVKTSSSTTITSNTPSSSLAGQLVTIAFKVAGTTTPTGTVTVTASTSETCIGTLSGGVGSCGITFMTTGTRTLTAYYSGDNNFDISNSKTVSQSVTGPVATVSPSSIDFGTLYLGSISTKTVTLTNHGTTAMTVTGPLLSIVKGGNSNEFVEVNLCPKSLAAGKSCTITIAFVAGPYYTAQTATVSIMDNAPGNPQTVPLTALVINPQASLSATSLNFGTQTVNSSATKTVTLKNTGTTPLSSIAMTISGKNPSDFSSSTCGTSLNAGSSCTISITFKPAAKGARSASLKITDNAKSGTQTIALSGTGK